MTREETCAYMKAYNAVEKNILRRRELARERSRNATEEQKSRRRVIQKKYEAKCSAERGAIPRISLAGLSPEQLAEHKKAVRKAWREKNVAHLAEKKKLDAERTAQYQKAYAEKRPDRSEYMKNFEAARKEGRKAYWRSWAAANPERRRESFHKQTIKNVQGLSDKYVRTQIALATGIDRRLIPVEMIEAHRQRMKVSRLIKELRK